MTQLANLKRLGFVLILCLLAGFTGAVGVASDARAETVVDQRVQAMKKMGGAMRVLSAFARGGAYDDRLPDAAAAISDAAGAIPRLFPPMTGRGQIDQDTRALPNIWSDPAGFARQTMALKAAARQIDAAVANKDAAAVGLGLKAAGATCGACHKPYRAPK